jgi:RimJ/RimL family protein N-acetyltransferase
MIRLSLSRNLEPREQEQYEALLDKANTDPQFYGIKLPDVERVVMFLDGEVIGFFEPEKMEYKGYAVFRSNRPYVAKEHRGQGYMHQALKMYYSQRKPGLAWVDDDNIASIRLFLSIGFKKEDAFFHKNKNGHFYILPRNA